MDGERFVAGDGLHYVVSVKRAGGRKYLEGAAALNYYGVVFSLGAGKHGEGEGGFHIVGKGARGYAATR